MIGPEDNSITPLVEKMQRKRDELLKELEKVQEWLNQMDVIINRGKAIIGAEPAINHEPPAKTLIDEEKPETKAGRILRLIEEKPDAEKSYAEKIKKLFEELGGMRVPKIDAQFRERNWPINGKNRNQIIRNALHRKSEWFVLSKDNKIWDLRKRIGQSVQAQ